MSSIRNTVLLYRPSLSVWSARKKDKAESAKVTKDNGAVDGSANVNKQLLPDCKELEAVQTWANSFRTFIYTNTSPWDDSGWRCGHVVKHMDFMAEAGDRMAQGYQLRDELVRHYLTLMADAKFKLNHMFNPADYPTEHEVKHKYHFSIEVQAMPAADDIRIIESVPAAEVDKLVKAAENAVNTRLAGAMEDTYQRLYKVVLKVATTLEQYDSKLIKKFNDSLIGNVAELVEVMPALNLTNSPKLAALAAEAKDLSLYAPLDLRTSDAVRRAAIQDARALAAKFTGVLDVADPVKAPVLARAPAPAAIVPAAPAEDIASMFAGMMD
jgi:hypothetical protein